MCAPRQRASAENCHIRRWLRLPVDGGGRVHVCSAGVVGGPTIWGRHRGGQSVWPTPPQHRFKAFAKRRIVMICVIGASRHARARFWRRGAPLHHHPATAKPQTLRGRIRLGASCQPDHFSLFSVPATAMSTGSGLKLVENMVSWCAEMGATPSLPRPIRCGRGKNKRGEDIARCLR